MIYVTYESAVEWCNWLNSRPGHVPVSIHRVTRGWTIW